MAITSDAQVLLPEAVELANGANFASVATIFPSGEIQNQTLWVGVRDDQIVINTETHRARFANVAKNPRITVLIRDEDNPYRYAEIRGEVVRTETGDAARTHVDELSRKYNGQDYPPGDIKSERVLLYVLPRRQTYVDQTADVGTED